VEEEGDEVIGGCRKRKTEMMREKGAGKCWKGEKRSKLNEVDRVRRIVGDVAGREGLIG